MRTRATGFKGQGTQCWGARPDAHWAAPTQTANENGASGCPLAPCVSRRNRVRLRLLDVDLAPALRGHRAAGEDVAGHFGHAGLVRRGLQAVRAHLARLVIRVRLGVDRRGVFHVAQRLGLRLARRNLGAGCIGRTAQQGGHRHGSNTEQRTLQQRAARKLLFGHLDTSPREVTISQRRDSTQPVGSQWRTLRSTASALIGFVTLHRAVANKSENHSQLYAQHRSRHDRTLCFERMMPDARRNRIKTYAGVAVSVLLAALAGWVLWRTFQRISFADVVAQMRALPASTLALAALCAAGAFTVLALYEVAVVRYVKGTVGRAKPMLTALIAFPLGHAVGQAMLSGGALRYRMYTPAGFSATEVGATVLLANLPYALAFGLFLDLALVISAETLEPMFRISSEWLRAIGCIGLAK